MSKSVGSTASPPLTEDERPSDDAAVEQGSADVSAAVDAVKDIGRHPDSKRPKLHLSQTSK